MSTLDDVTRDGPVVTERPVPGTPRPYAFPDVATHRLANGLTVLLADLPGRPLISASLIMANGAADEPPETAGATVLSIGCAWTLLLAYVVRSANSRRSSVMALSRSS